MIRHGLSRYLAAGFVLLSSLAAQSGPSQPDAGSIAAPTPRFDGLVHDGDRWISREQAQAQGSFWYRDRWLSSKLERQAKRWARFDARVSGWEDAYSDKVGAYRVETDVPRHIYELDIKPFLAAVFETYVDTFRGTFGLEGRAVRNKDIKIYRSFSEYSAQNDDRPRSNPAFIRGGQTLYCYYDETDPDRFYGSVFHEGAHQFVKGLLPGVDFPKWLDEGLATFYEGCKYSRVDRRVTVGVASARRLKSAKTALRPFIDRVDEDGTVRLVPIESGRALPRVLFMDLPDSRFGSRQYALAWSFIHYLVHRDGGRYRDAFGAFLRESNGAGAKTVDEIWGSVCRTPLAELEEGWVQYVLDLEPEPAPSWVVVGAPDLSAYGLEEGLRIFSFDGVLVWDGDHLDRLWENRAKDRDLPVVCVRDDGVGDRAFVEGLVPAGDDGGLFEVARLTRGYYLID